MAYIVSFTHDMASDYMRNYSSCLKYEKYDTVGVAFDLSSLHSYVKKYEIKVYVKYTKNQYYTQSWTGNLDIGLNPYTTGGSTALDSTPTTTIRTTVTINGGAQIGGGQWVTFTFEDTMATNQSNLLDKPFYICSYQFLNVPSGSSLAVSTVPVIGRVIRQYSLPIPAAGDKITHSGLAAFATWCKMTGSASHTTTNTILSASETNRPWGTSVTFINSSGGSVTTSSDYAKTAGTTISTNWIQAVLDNRSWVR